MHKRQSEFFFQMEGVRGIFALLIAIYHVNWSNHSYHIGFFQNGALAVDIFFVFSGFLMYWLYGQRLTSARDGADFMKRRFARIYPLHFVLLFVWLAFELLRLMAHMTGLASTSPGETWPLTPDNVNNVWSFLTHLFLVNGMGTTEGLSFNPPAWTNSVEFFAYVVFATIIILWRPVKAWQMAIIALCVAGLYGFLSRIKPDLHIHYDWGFVRCLAGFFTGVLAAWTYRFIHERKERISFLQATLMELVTFVGIFVFAHFVHGKGQFFVAPLIYVLVISFAIGRGAVSRIFEKGAFVYLGRISYSIYLNHAIFAFVIATILERTTGGYFDYQNTSSVWVGDMIILGYLVAVIVTSHFTYKYIEVPGRRAILNWQWRRTPRTETA